MEYNPLMTKTRSKLGDHRRGTKEHNIAAGPRSPAAKSWINILLPLTQRQMEMLRQGGAGVKTAAKEGGRTHSALTLSFVRHMKPKREDIWTRLSQP
jgi:hypothetical protein